MVVAAETPPGAGVVMWRVAVGASTAGTHTGGSAVEDSRSRPYVDLTRVKTLDRLLGVGGQSKCHIYSINPTKRNA